MHPEPDTPPTEGVQVSDSELMRQVQGYNRVDRKDKRHVEEARAIVHHVQRRGLMADGSAALTIKIMKNASDEYDAHKELAQGDTAKEMMLSAIMQHGVAKMVRIQDGLFDSWGL